MQVITIGRDSRNDIVINESKISRYHAQIIKDGNSYRIVDFNSTNGTYVNNMRIRGEIRIMPGDVVYIGNTILPWQNYFGNSMGTASVPGRRRNGFLIGVGTFVAVIAISAGLYFFSSDFQEGFNEVYKTSGISLPGEVRFSSLSYEKQKKLKTDLFERLDRYFLSLIKDDEALMRLLLLSTMSENSNLLEKRIEKEMVKVVEQWASDNNIDVEDWASTDAEEFVADYILHLVQLVMVNK
jgi:pSer/pThr/pTyr-binding forkhead associated (FHA) protein